MSIIIHARHHRSVQPPHFPSLNHSLPIILRLAENTQPKTSTHTHTHTRHSIYCTGGRTGTDSQSRAHVVTLALGPQPRLVVHSLGCPVEPLGRGADVADETLTSRSVASSAAIRFGFSGRTADTNPSYTSWPFTSRQSRNLAALSEGTIGAQICSFSYLVKRFFSCSVDSSVSTSGSSLRSEDLCRFKACT